MASKRAVSISTSLITIRLVLSDDVDDRADDLQARERRGCARLGTTPNTDVILVAGLQLHRRRLHYAALRLGGIHRMYQPQRHAGRGSGTSLASLGLLPIICQRNTVVLYGEICVIALKRASHIGSSAYRG